MLAGYLRGLVGPDGDGPRARLVVVDASPTGEPLTELGLARLTAGPVKARRAVEILARRTREPSRTPSTPSSP